MLIGIIAVIIFLSILILVHEVGHFLAAKKFGLLVEEFGFGLPPRIWGKKIGETIYSINALPFGGFVKIFGEEQSEQSELHQNLPNNIRIVESELSYKLTGLFFQAQDQLGRFAREKQYGDVLENLFKKEGIEYKREIHVSVGGKNSNIVDFLIEDKVVIELKSKPFISRNDYYQAKRYLDSMNLELGLIVNFREPHLKPKRILNPKFRILSQGSDSFVDSDKVRSFGLLPIWKRSLILFAGVFMNFLLGWLVISIVFSIGIPKAILITEVVPGSPAAEIGLVAGDKIVQANADQRGLDADSRGLELESFIKFINEHRGETINLEIERLGEIFDIKAVPRIDPPEGQGALGIALVEGGSPKMGIFSSFYEGLKTSVEITKSIVVAIFSLLKSAFIGEATLESVAGPVGIVKITAQAGTLGFIYLLQLLALISLNLAVINIIPFPALDGGRLLFLVIEKIKGSPLNPKFERFANAAGMALLLLLMLLITVKDISRFF